MKKTPKQIAALICIGILILLYVLLFLSSILNLPNWDKLFRACLYGTITIPLLTWIYIFLYGKLKDRHTIASLDIGQTKEDTLPQDKQ